ncbi:MAG TPA: SDR family oxidoreductase [Arthrobacter sp.]|nr:SDR family oxidoreductase [Arthrobacter sp.]
MSGLFSLAGKVALVVGAGAGGLGERIATALAEQGAVLAIADREVRSDDLEATSRRCGGASVHFCDVTDEAQVEALLSAVVERHGRLDILVNAAGVMLRKAYDETSLEEFQRVIGVNLTGTWLLNRAAGRRMSTQGSGKIVNLSTVYAERVGPVPESAYYASKAGIANVTRALAAELGPHGITVNCVAPGVFYPTQMTAALAESPDQLAWFSQRTMLGRLGDPARDIAGPVILLASDASAYMTGQVVYVDGGWSAW